MKRHAGKKVVNPQWQPFELLRRDLWHQVSFAVSPILARTGTKRMADTVPSRRSFEKRVLGRVVASEEEQITPPEGLKARQHRERRVAKKPHRG
jgi:hypothetical protein